MAFLPQRLRPWLLAAFLAAGAPGLAPAQQGAAEAPFPVPDWPLSTPEAQGMDSAALAGLYDYLATPGFNTDSVLVIRHGRIVSETYVPPYRAGLRHDLRSVTKAVVSTLVGAAIQEGKIRGTSQKALEFFPGHPAGSPEQADLTLQHLLDMASGMAWRETPYDAESDAYKLWASRHWVQFILDRPMASEPGRKFHYMAAAPHLLSAIVGRSTGLSTAEYARRGVFGALGIRDFEWLADPQGVSIGESTLRLAPRDMAKIGYLLLRQGRWQQRQLLPPGWTEAVLTQGVAAGQNPAVAPTSYSRLWWVDRTVPYFSALGRHGQHIIVLPKHDVVAVVTSKTFGGPSAARAAEMVQRHLLPAVRGEQALAENPAAQARLADAVAALSAKRHAPPSHPPSAAALALAAQRFLLAPNSGGYLGFALDLKAPQPSYLLLQASRATPRRAVPRGGPLGLDGQFVVSGAPGPGQWARRGRWIDESTFRIEAQQLESAILGEWTLSFANGRLEIAYADGDGQAFKLQGTVQPPAAPKPATP